MSLKSENNFVSDCSFPPRPQPVFGGEHVQQMLQQQAQSVLEEVNASETWCHSCSSFLPLLQLFVAVRYLGEELFSA